MLSLIILIRLGKKDYLIYLRERIKDDVQTRETSDKFKLKCRLLI